MKTALTGMLLGIAFLANTQESRADVKAPPGTHFEVQVEIASVRHHGGKLIVRHRWETYAGPYKYLSQAEDEYDVLADAAEAGKLAKLVDLPASTFPTAVRLVFVIEGTSAFNPDEVIVVESVEAQ